MADTKETKDDIKEEEKSSAKSDGQKNEKERNSDSLKKLFPNMQDFEDFDPDVLKKK